MKKKTLTVTLTAVGVVLILVSTVNLFLVLIDRSSHEYFFAQSGSMEPAYGKGVCLKVKLGVNIYEIYVAPKPDGDIIAFYSPLLWSPGIVIHRAVGNGTDTSYYIITQGDANAGQDMWRVRETDIIGKVVEINPPFWTYNYIFWGVIYASGVVILLVGVILKFRSKRTLTETK